MSKDSARVGLTPGRIKVARKNAGLSQGQLAKILRLHRPAVSEIEAGNRKVTATELRQIAEATDVSVSWLVGESAQTLALDDPRVELAARELKRLDPQDLDRLLEILAAIKDDRKKTKS